MYIYIYVHINILHVPLCYIHTFWECHVLSWSCGGSQMKKEPTYTADSTQSREEHQHIFTSPSHGCVDLLYVYLWVSVVCPTLCESQPIPKICGANN